MLLPLVHLTEFALLEAAAELPVEVFPKLLSREKAILVLVKARESFLQRRQLTRLNFEASKQRRDHPLKVVLLAAREFYHLKLCCCHFICISLTLLLLTCGIGFTEPGVAEERCSRGTLVRILVEG